MILGMEINCTSNNIQATIAKVTHSHYIQRKKVFRGTYIGIWLSIGICSAHKMKFSIKDFFSKSDQIRRRLRTWSHLMKKLLMENFIFCAVTYFSQSQSTFNIFKKKRPITIRSVPQFNIWSVDLEPNPHIFALITFLIHRKILQAIHLFIVFCIIAFVLRVKRLLKQLLTALLEILLPVYFQKVFSRQGYVSQNYIAVLLLCVTV